MSTNKYLSNYLPTIRTKQHNGYVQRLQVTSATQPETLTNLLQQNRYAAIASSLKSLDSYNSP